MIASSFRSMNSIKESSIILKMFTDKFFPTCGKNNGENSARHAQQSFSLKKIPVATDGGLLVEFAIAETLK